MTIVMHRGWQCVTCSRSRRRPIRQQDEDDDLQSALRQRIAAGTDGQLDGNEHRRPCQRRQARQARDAIALHSVAASLTAAA